MNIPSDEPRASPDGPDASDQARRDVDRPVLIELEPLDTTPAPQRNVGQHPDARVESSGVGYVIPERPLHLCPNCDYNLTGLTSRRCPECGEEFTLNDARTHGFEASDAMRSLRRRVRWGNARVVIGIVLMVLAFIGANSVRLGNPFGPTFTPLNVLTLPGVILLILIGGMLLVTTLCKLYFEWAWPNLILGIGLIVAALAIPIMLI